MSWCLVLIFVGYHHILVVVERLWKSRQVAIEGGDSSLDLVLLRSGRGKKNKNLLFLLHFF